MNVTLCQMGAYNLGKIPTSLMLHGPCDRFRVWLSEFKMDPFCEVSIDCIWLICMIFDDFLLFSVFYFFQTCCVPYYCITTLSYLTKACSFIIVCIYLYGICFFSVILCQCYSTDLFGIRGPHEYLYWLIISWLPFLWLSERQLCMYLNKNHQFRYALWYLLKHWGIWYPY